MGDKRWRKVKKLSANEISDLNVTVTGMVADIISNDSAIITELADKVDKVEGKQLSTEDFTTTQKNKLDSFTPSAFIADSPTDTIESLALHVDSIRDAMISSGFMLPE